MNRRRSRLIVELDLDPVPGWGNDPEDHRAWLQRTLDDSAGHYHPTVTIVADADQVCLPEFGQDPADCATHAHVPSAPVVKPRPSLCGNDACLCRRGGVS